jgi:hypothetical protein
MLAAQPVWMLAVQPAWTLAVLAVLAAQRRDVSGGSIT